MTKEEARQKAQESCINAIIGHAFSYTNADFETMQEMQLIQEEIKAIIGIIQHSRNIERSLECAKRELGLLEATKKQIQLHV